MNTGQGKKTHEHYMDLAAKLFHDVESPDEWRDVAIKELVKNHVTKYAFFSFKNLLYDIS
jgi:hypothetical protein